MKASFRIIFEENCQKQGQRWIYCLKEPTFCQNGQFVKSAQDLRKSHLFQTSLDLN